MKIKLDENLPVALMEALQVLGHDTETAPDEGLGGMADEKVFRAAQAEGRFFVTQDLDFSDVRHFLPGTHSGILLVRLKCPGRTALLEKITRVFEREDVTNWRGCFVVVTDRKVRVRHPVNPNQ